MKIDFEKALKSALKFSIVPEKLLLLFLFNLVVLGLIGVSTLGLIAGVATGSLILPGIGFLAGTIIAIFAGVLVQIMVIHNYGKTKNLIQSFAPVKPRYLTALGAILFIVLISMILSTIPYVSNISGLIVALVFFFIFQEAVLTKNKIKKVIVNSWNLFKNNIGVVVIGWIISMVVTLLITAVFALPVIAVLIKTITIASLTNLTETALITSIGGAVKANIILFTISGLLFLVGASISKLFSLGFVTDVWQQLKKK